MENNMKNFDDLFRDGLSGHEEVPPQRVWESLEKRLSSGAAAKPVGTGWYWYVCIASFAVLLGGLGWNMSHKDAPVASLPSASTVAAESNTPKVVAEEATAVAEEVPTADNAGKRAMNASPTHEKGSARVADKSVNELTPYGNAVAVGTSIHSYDDFDERASAGTHKTMANAGDEHVKPGYRINKIRKNRLKAAEMVPVGHSTDVLSASVATEAPVMPKKEEPKVAVKTTTRRRATILKKEIVVDNQRKTVKQEATAAVAEEVASKVATTDKTPEATTDKVAPASTVAETAPATTAPATPASHPEKLIATSASKPAVTGSAVVPKTKPATVVPQGKPSTGGSEPITKANSSDSSTQDSAHAEDGSEGQRQKGLRGMFRRMKRNNK